ELFFDKQAECALSSLGTGSVGIKVHNYVLGIASQQTGLEFCERSAGTGDNVVKSGGVNGNAVHLSLDEDCVIELADSFLGEIEIKKDARLGIDGCLWRIQVLRTGFFVSGKRTPRKRDDLAGLVGNGKDHTVAEFGVDRRGPLIVDRWSIFIGGGGGGEGFFVRGLFWWRGVGGC